MGNIIKPFTFSPNTTANSSQVNANLDTIYNDYNGNISSVNLANDAVTTAKIADANVTTAKLADASVTAGKVDGSVPAVLYSASFSAQSSVSSGTIPARNNLAIYITQTPSTALNLFLRFNGDSGNNYAVRTEVNGGADTTATSQPQINMIVSSGTPNSHYVTIKNIATIEKHVYVTSGTSGASTGAGTAPSKAATVGKWANSSDQITSILLGASTGNITGHITVIGWN